jgi:hypothetical protein
VAPHLVVTSPTNEPDVVQPARYDDTDQVTWQHRYSGVLAARNAEVLSNPRKTLVERLQHQDSDDDLALLMPQHPPPPPLARARLVGRESTLLVAASIEELKDESVPRLKARLKAAHLPLSGSKEDLVERLDRYFNTAFNRGASSQRPTVAEMEQEVEIEHHDDRGDIQAEFAEQQPSIDDITTLSDVQDGVTAVDDSGLSPCADGRRSWSTIADFEKENGAPHDRHSSHRRLSAGGVLGGLFRRSLGAVGSLFGQTRVATPEAVQYDTEWNPSA